MYIKSRQTREMKYNTKRIAEVQKIKTYWLGNKNKQSETQYKLGLSKAKSINNNLQILVYW